MVDIFGHYSSSQAKRHHSFSGNGHITSADEKGKAELPVMGPSEKPSTCHWIHSQWQTLVPSARTMTVFAVLLATRRRRNSIFRITVGSICRHTKAAPNGKCCEGYIVPSMARLMYQLKSVLK